MLTSLTLTNYFEDDISEEIINYIKSKGIKKVKLIVRQELKEDISKTFSINEFETLRSLIQECLIDDGKSFLLNLQSINTSFEKFSYGIEMNSEEENVKEKFGKYV